ncbi:nucleoside kinase [Breznakiella homolactica]|uniref:Nucleoside kinase n=1 Tax=Breznakiella homolactica TaxID=2798577 RepID=A0A7T7XJB7_9SPIR|nr:nucleoside kinase [Breznakiella homolactica]QQO07426.1 nucleoside kinase [Breznakiella homolactica]
MNEIQISFPNGTSVHCPIGTRADELVDNLSPLHEELAAVKVNNEIVPLSSRIEINAAMEPVLMDMPDGVMIYRRSLAFLLAVAARDLFPDRSIYVGHSLGNSYYYTFANDRKPSPEEIKALESQMKKLVEEDLPIEFSYMAYSEALELFKKNNQTDTAFLLEQRSDSKIPVNRCRDFVDLYIEPLVPRTGILRAFELMDYKDGFLLRFPGFGQGTVGPFEDSEKIFSVYNEYKKWGRIIGVHAVGHLNKLVSDRTIRDYIRIAEAFQSKKMAEIADRIYERRDSVRVVLIAGPSSSGKTTSAKRLAIQLKVMGIEPIMVGLDDYYLGPEDAPKDENGEPDLECLEALDVPYLNEQLLALFRGDEVEIPSFDFKIGKRRESGGKKIRLERRSMLILEGIHGLNDALTPEIDRDKKFTLYVSALTQLNLDDHNRIPTSDNRLLRRMVRDYQFRGNNAAQTIRMWPSVQRGERRHIFPFQNGADVAFNSALDYELAVLKFYAEPLLRSVKPNMAEYSEAVRLLSFLENFAPIPPQYVPGNSILREFIGESEFKY